MLLPDRTAKAARERVDKGEYPALATGHVDGDTHVDVFGKFDSSGNRKGRWRQLSIANRYRTVAPDR